MNGFVDRRLIDTKLKRDRLCLPGLRKPLGVGHFIQTMTKLLTLVVVKLFDLLQDCVDLWTHAGGPKLDFTVCTIIR